MNFSELKDKQKVNVYIPVTRRFYKMEVTSCTHHDDGNGGFTISNYDTEAIQGHTGYLYRLKDQEDLDNFFYVEKAEPGKPNEESYKNGDQHYLKNNKGWIFK